MELFPKSTNLVVGPGFRESPTLLPGYPHLTDSPIDSRAVEGRNLVQLDFKDHTLDIGGFRAHDFFGDGSLYLLGKRTHCQTYDTFASLLTRGLDSRHSRALSRTPLRPRAHDRWGR